MTINVDPAEIARFSELAHRWWDPASDFKPLHDINPLRLDYIDRCAGLSGKTVLDVGCGGGILAESMAQRGAQVTGIDLSDKALKVAQLHVLESGVVLDYRHSSAEDFARERPQHYDIVTCMELLEHVPDPASTVRACATLAKAGGHVFFSTINRNLKSYLFASSALNTCCACCREARTAMKNSSSPPSWADFAAKAVSTCVRSSA
jgi:2-polyprenyl-6-hydroxyphenyl methylase/3-demethylubiquinone-9 3-methyltransferase